MFQKADSLRSKIPRRWMYHASTKVAIHEKTKKLKGNVCDNIIKNALTHSSFVTNHLTIPSRQTAGGIHPDRHARGSTISAIASPSIPPVDQ